MSMIMTTTIQIIPVLARPKRGFTVNQLFTLMIGTLLSDLICHRKPTSVTYSGMFAVDLTCVHCIDDLRADDNGVWTHAGKPRRGTVLDVILKQWAYPC